MSSTKTMTTLGGRTGGSAASAGRAIQQRTPTTSAREMRGIQFSYRKHASVLLAAHLFDVHLHRVDRLAGGDEQRVAVLAAEADVGGPRLGDVDLLDLVAALAVDADALAGEVDVPLVVDRHAVGAELAEELL